MVGAQMQSFWAVFVHVAACPFPGGWRCEAGAAWPLGVPNVYMRMYACL